MESVRNPGPPPSPSRDAWSRYWRGGALHSCGGAFAGNYEGPTAAFWRAQFDGVPDGGTVVDLGTGNGAVALLARDAATALGRRFEVHGVDSAAIDPAASLPDGARVFAGIRFHPGTSATQLPFDDGSVALACGQYAFEYLPRDAAVREVCRVLGTGGRAALVLHSRDSLVLATTAEQLDHCRLLFEESVVFSRARLMGEVLATANTAEARRALADDVRAQTLRHELNESAGLVMERAEAAKSPALLRTALGAISSTLQAAAQLGPEGVVEQLTRHERALRDEWDRLCDLDEAALDESQAVALRERFADAGYAASTLGRLDHAPGQRLGWTLVVAS